MALCLTLALSACSSVPLTSAWKLRNVNPIEADPALFKIAVITNELIQLQTGSTSIGLGYTAEDPKHSFNTIVEATVKPNAIEAQLGQYLKSHEHITLFTLNEEATRQLRIAQNRIKTIKDKDIDGKGNLAVSINTACMDGPKPETVNANIFVMFDPSQGFVKLVSNLDLLKASKSNKQSFWVECEKAKGLPLNKR